MSSVTVGNSLATIGEYAFADCTSLPSITLPNTVTTIGGSAFNYCTSLASFTIPNLVISISSGTFQSCSSLISVVIPNTLKYIENQAFQHCTSLASVTLPDSTKTIGYAAFYQCSNLLSVTIPEGVVGIENEAFRISGLITVNYNAINCTSTGLQNAFECYFKTLNIGSKVEILPARAFEYCPELAFINIGESLAYIGKGAFRYTPDLIDITVHANNLNYSSVNGVLFDKLQNTLIKYPAAKAGAHYTIPNTVTFIGYYAFYDSENLTSLSMPNGLITIDDYAFSGCRNLTVIAIPNSVTSIGDNAFSYCQSLLSVNIPNLLPVIKHATFYLCDSLETITIPASVTAIANGAFGGCTGLTSITALGLTPPGVIFYSSFEYVSDTTPVHIPCGKTTAYVAYGWSYFNNIIESVTHVVTLVTNDSAMGVASQTKMHTCADNIAIIEANAATGDGDFRFILNSFIN